MTKIESVQKELEKKDILKFTNKEELIFKDEADFIKRFFNLNDDYKTIYIKDNTEQCGSGHNRSLGDIFNIARHYLKEVDISKLMKELIIFYNNDIVGTFWCKDIEKRVFFTDRNYSRGNFHGYWGKDIDKIDELSFGYNDYNNIYSVEIMNESFDDFINEEDEENYEEQDWYNYRHLDDNYEEIIEI